MGGVTAKQIAEGMMPSLYEILRACPHCLQRGDWFELSERGDQSWECEVCGAWWDTCKDLLRVKNGMGHFDLSRKLLAKIEGKKERVKL